MLNETGADTVFANVKQINDTRTKNTASPINANENNLSSFYKDGYNAKDIFDKFYSQAIELMGGDRLLKPLSSLNRVIIRKTTTQGLYKVIISSNDTLPKIKYMDESELLNSRLYTAATISKLGDDEYEITYFDNNDEISIEHFSKQEAINFMNENKLIFQI